MVKPLSLAEAVLQSQQSLLFICHFPLLRVSLPRSLPLFSTTQKNPQKPEDWLQQQWQQLQRKARPKLDGAKCQTEASTLKAPTDSLHLPQILCSQARRLGKSLVRSSVLIGGRQTKEEKCCLHHVSLAMLNAWSALWLWQVVCLKVLLAANECGVIET